MEGQLQGKVAVVTGAASGIGLASTEALLSSGARVVLVDRDDVAVTSICRNHGDAAIPLVMDLLDSKACSTLVPRVLDMRGKSTSCMPMQVSMSGANSWTRRWQRLT